MIVIVALTLSGCSGCFGCGGEKEEVKPFPDKVITIHCPKPEGSVDDRIARAIAIGIERAEGGSWNVEVVNYSGFSSAPSGEVKGLTGIRQGAREPADGYSICYVTPEVQFLHQDELTREFTTGTAPITFICRLFTVPAVVVVPRDSAIQNVAELKALDGNLRLAACKYEDPEATSDFEFRAAIEFADALGKPTEYVPANTPADSLAKLSDASIGVHAAVLSFANARAAMRRGDVRALCVLDSRRLDDPAFASVPTAMEELEASGPCGILYFGGLAVSTATPRDVYFKLAEACGRAFKTGEFRDELDAVGVTANWLHGKNLRLFIENPKLAFADDIPRLAETQTIGSAE
ncbi:MAG: tripartite tricarboxylate transporter substrate-binding protein [Planctomycetes bacterium]|nr:tripartite tricarboxylate transporter substrate-binding protein [Planctomycetota bacterium]